MDKSTSWNALCPQGPRREHNARTEDPPLTRGRTLLVPVLAAALTGADALSSATPAPEAPERRTPAMVERATVELVLIEAYVTDSQGRPLRGLTPDDFSLMVDGHAKPIHSLEFREVADATPAPETGPAVETAPETAQRAAARFPRRFILFFEDSTSAAPGLTAARQAALRFLDGSLVHDDQVALASYDRKLRILHDFTTDRTSLRQAVEASLKDLRRFTDYASDQGKFEREIEEILARGRNSGGPGAEMSSKQVGVMAVNYAVAFTPRSRDVLSALTTLVDSLAPYPGYKGIVFMGDGVAENPAVDFLQRFGASGTSSAPSHVERFELSLGIKQLAHYASAAGVTLHS